MENAVLSRAPMRRAGLLILVLAYTGFIALGLVNSLMGVAWPSIRDTFGLPLDALGVLLIGNTTGYMLASAVSGRLMSLMSVGTMLALSCCVAAISLLASGSAPFWLVLVALGFTSGLSGGAIVGVAQLALAACFGLTRQLWGDAPPVAGAAALADGTAPAVGAPLAATLQLPIAWLGIVLFFVYTGVEVATGNWVFSLLTEARGVPAALAGAWVSLYWASLTLGRILFGFAVQRISPTTLLRWCMAGAVLSALLIWLNMAPWLTFTGIALMGLALAPQFPLLMSATPGYLGARHAANGVGFQVAAASLGAALLPSLVGVLARANGLEVLGPSLFVAALIMAALYELLVWRVPASARETEAGL